MRKNNNNNDMKGNRNETKTKNIGIMKPINCYSSLKDKVVDDLKGTGRCIYAN